MFGKLIPDKQSIIGIRFASQNNNIRQRSKDNVCTMHQNMSCK